MFRFDSVVLVNIDNYGSPAACSPVLHIQRIAGGKLFDHSMSGYDRCWEHGTPTR